MLQLFACYQVNLYQFLEDLSEITDNKEADIQFITNNHILSKYIKVSLFTFIFLLFTLSNTTFAEITSTNESNKKESSTLQVTDFPLFLEYYLLNNKQIDWSYDAWFEEFKNSKIQVQKVPVEESKDILQNLQWPIEYKVQKWDTLESIWHRANIDPRYIVESNVWIIYWKVNKSSPNFVDEWQTILIPNKTGIAYKVQEGDTKESIMEEFNFWLKTWKEYNDIEDVKEWDIIVFPISNERLYGLDQNTVDFYWWNCTWYVGSKLMWQINWWWNANHWLNNAKKAGNKVNMEPKVNSIIVMGWKTMPHWHVGIVEEVLDDKIVISEMNYTWLNKVSRRTLLKSNKSIKWYIHTLKNSIE